jgi:hypothetical protein
VRLFWRQSQLVRKGLLSPAASQICYTVSVQKIATRVFVIASVVFGILGIAVALTQPNDNSVLSKLLLITVFIILPSFALSVAGKYLNDK